MNEHFHVCWQITAICKLLYCLHEKFSEIPTQKIWKREFPSQKAKAILLALNYIELSFRSRYVSFSDLNSVLLAIPKHEVD